MNRELLMGKPNEEELRTLAADIDEICVQHGINTHWVPFGKNWANKELREIQVEEITCTGNYAAALHEIGHIFCDQESKPNDPLGELTQQCRAWQWAIDKRQACFDGQCWRRMHADLREYARPVRDIPTEHAFHALVALAETNAPDINPYGTPSFKSSKRKQTPSGG
jgi:hypothetical protein